MSFPMQRPIRNSTLCAVIFAGVVPFIAGAGVAAVASKEYVVSQAGRAFKPGDLKIQRGETVQIVNDDGDLLHHVYLDSDRFSFDSGDQGPGSRTNITFPLSGTFTVLCAIHPKMKLIVQVSDPAK
jgi:plastocyanin